MRRIWIIGAGKFGQKAANTIRQKTPKADLVIVDRDIDACRNLRRQYFDTICMNGIDFLLINLTDADSADRIVPAIPVHLAYEWIRRKVAPTHRFIPIAIPDRLLMSLPNPIKGDTGELYVSNADFICPENCPEPKAICTYTGLPRPRALHQVLSSIPDKGFYSIVITSRQMYPGIGGYSARSLFAALKKVKQATHPVLLSTACRCHGVMNAFRVVF